MSKTRLYDTLILFLTLLITVGIPFELFIKKEIVVLILRFIMNIAFIIFAIIFIKKHKMDETPILCKTHIKDLLYLPFIVICFSNIIFLLIDKNVENGFNVSLFIISVIYMLSVAIAEEIVFRYAFLNGLRYLTPFKCIFFSALIFGLTHLVANFFNFDFVGGLIQGAYTFGIGLVCGLIYYYSRNIFYTIIFHFLFNVANSVLFAMLYIKDYPLSFYLVNGIIAVVFLLYGFLVYYLNNKNNDSLSDNGQL